MVKSMIKSRAAGIHIEDQEEQKRCGHRPNKKLVSSKEMQDRLKAAVDARNDPDTFRYLYSLAVNNPDHYSLPRMFRAGISLQF